jgi:hypothetical protein
MARIVQGQDVEASEYYFRTTPVFETASDKYSWLSRIVTVVVGGLAPNWVGYTVYTIL